MALSETETGMRKRRLNWLHNLNHLLSYFLGILLIEMRWGEQFGGAHHSWKIQTIKDFELDGGKWGPRRWYWPHR